MLFYLCSVVYAAERFFIDLNGRKPVSKSYVIGFLPKFLEGKHIQNATTTFEKRLQNGFKG